MIIVPAESNVRALSIAVSPDVTVSGILQAGRVTSACYVMAHGAGAGMIHPFMSAVANDLAAAGIATLRYQFPYMERRGKRPDAPALCHATVRAAVATARKLLPDVGLMAGGKSFGGRMTSQAQAENPLEGVRALAFFGFPLHPPQRPSAERAAHLGAVRVPMLFLQGSRDEFADSVHLCKVIEGLGPRATLEVVDQADHSFHVPVRSGRTDAETRATLVRLFAAWAAGL